MLEPLEGLVDRDLNEQGETWDRRRYHVEQNSGRVGGQAATDSERNNRQKEAPAGPILA